MNEPVPDTFSLRHMVRGRRDNRGRPLDRCQTDKRPRLCLLNVSWVIAGISRINSSNLCHRYLALFERRPVLRPIYLLHYTVMAVCLSWQGNGRYAMVKLGTRLISYNLSVCQMHTWLPVPIRARFCVPMATCTLYSLANKITAEYLFKVGPFYTIHFI